MPHTGAYVSSLRTNTIDFTVLPAGATFLRILGVNYVRLKTAEGGDLYVTEYGLPFREHLKPENWLEEEYFKAKRQRLEGTSAVYRVPTRPLPGYVCRSIDLVVKWSRVGQDVPLDTFTLNKAINAEFNTPFEEFSLVEELRQGRHGPSDVRVLMQKPMAIYAPPERMQLWQTGRSKDKIVTKVARHPGIEIDILRSYILLYAWLEGYDCVQTYAGMPWERQRQIEEQQKLLQMVNVDLEKKGFMVADNKPTHIILRQRNGQVVKRRGGDVLYGLVDYELLTRTPHYEEVVKKGQRSRYLKLQSTRFSPAAEVSFPEGLKPASVLDVKYVYGRSESTGGSLWVVGKNPELFSYFLPEKWRFKQVNLSHRRQTYYVQSKDRIHLVWEVSRLGEMPEETAENRERYEELMRYGYNTPFEEITYALQVQRKGLPTTYPRAIYMTGQEVQMPSCIVDESRFAHLREVKAPDGQPALRLDRDYILIWGYWRGLEDDQAPGETGYWSPIDAARAAVIGLIEESELAEIVQEQRRRLWAAGFEDMSLRGEHILLSYIPDGAIKRGADGYYELRQCNFEMVRPVSPA